MTHESIQCSLRLESDVDRICQVPHVSIGHSKPQHHRVSCVVVVTGVSGNRRGQLEECGVSVRGEDESGYSVVCGYVEHLRREGDGEVD